MAGRNDRLIQQIQHCDRVDPHGKQLIRLAVTLSAVEGLGYSTGTQYRQYNKRQVFWLTKDCHLTAAQHLPTHQLWAVVHVAVTKHCGLQLRVQPGSAHLQEHHEVGPLYDNSSPVPILNRREPVPFAAQSNRKQR